MKYLERSVEDKEIVWIKESNRYMLVEMPAYNVIKRLADGTGAKEVTAWCSRNYGLPEAESIQFVEGIQQLINEQSANKRMEHENNPSVHSPFPPINFFSQKFYKIAHFVFSAAYETKELEHLIHPKFAHLETTKQNSCSQYFQVFRHQEQLVLRVNEEIIGQWLPEEDHFLAGKFSMSVVNQVYGKLESDWMAVFHASAISQGNQCILFLGNSGSGKSTLSALLMAKGFNLLADDFVPVDAISKQVFHFPAAVSIKKNALNNLLPLFPELESASEYDFQEMDKIVRYLPPLPILKDQVLSCTCKALVFVKYKKDSGFKLEKLPKDEAFSQLVPDSWLSPLPENASIFLDWFLELPCFRLTYSDNDKMVHAIEKLFQDDIS